MTEKTPDGMDPNPPRPAPRPAAEPRTIAVVGASGGGGTAGAEVVRGLLAAGFAGGVYAVDPHSSREDLHGASRVAALADLPGPPDLAILTVPADAVVAAAAACGRSGTPLLVVAGRELTARQERDLRAVCRRYGMRRLAAWPPPRT